MFQRETCFSAADPLSFRVAGGNTANFPNTFAEKFDDLLRPHATTPAPDLLILLLVPPITATVMGWLVGAFVSSPVRARLNPGLIREADASFAHSRAQREDFN